ncbi:Gfo/Idh/MocA family protein [Propionibacteriaceae bacterium Y2011]
MAETPTEQATNKVRVGILGLGRSGWGIHAAGMAEVADQYQVVAVADAMPDRLEEAKEKFGCDTYTTPEELIADADVELIIVATPSHTHVPLGLAAIEAGRNVVIEKPMATTLAEVDQLTAAAEKAGVVVTAFQNQRLDPSFLAVKEVFDSGRLGEIILVRRTVHRFARRADWQTLRSMGGGELPNTALHFLDQLMTLLDPDTDIDVLGDLRRTNSAGDAEDHVKITLRPAEGPVLDLESSGAITFPQDSWYVVGTTGGIIGSPSELQVKWVDLSKMPAIEADASTPEGRKYGAKEEFDWQTETIAVPPPNQRTQQYYSKLYDTLRNGADLFVTPASVRKVVEVMESAREMADFA